MQAIGTAEFILEEAKRREKKTMGSGVSYLKEYLSTNPYFVSYLDMQKSNRKSREKQDEEYADTYPLFFRVKSFPNSTKNYEILKTFLQQELPSDVRLDALRWLVRYTKDRKELYEISKEIISFSDTKEDLFQFGYYAYQVGHHEEAFKALENSLPYSVKYLARCYENGLGCKKDKKKALELILSEAKNCNEAALKVLKAKLRTNEIDLEKVGKISSITTFHLTENHRLQLLEKAKEKSYLTVGDVKWIIDEHNPNLLDEAKEFLASYNCPVYEDLSLEYFEPICQLAHLYKLLDGYDVCPDIIDFINEAGIKKETIEFYADGVEEEDSYPETNYVHTPGEAAIFFDIPVQKAQVDFAMLDYHLHNLFFMEKVRKLIYELTFQIDAFDEEDSNSALDCILNMYN